VVQDIAAVIRITGIARYLMYFMPDE